MNRRDVNKSLALAAFGSSFALETALAQTTPPKAMKLVDLEKIDAKWKPLEFTFEGKACLLQKVTVPKEETPRALVVGKEAFSAVTRTCPHAGCQTELPQTDGSHVCDCHGSKFDALGLVTVGPARKPLTGVKLEVREKAIWAVALI
jgi:cytochrome b6-f complex iron-sulfur subunit